MTGFKNVKAYVKGKGIITTDIAVENGKITHPVEQITIAGNFYELLKTVAQVGNDLYFNSSAVGSPSLMFEDISVSGL